MTKEDRDIQRKLKVLRHAEKIGDVASTCRYFGVGRSSFYRWKNAYQQSGHLHQPAVLSGFGILASNLMQWPCFWASISLFPAVSLTFRRSYPIWCAEGPHVRLAGIAAREMDGSCRSNQPCPDATAAQARDALVGYLGVPTGRSIEGHVLVEGPTMRCRSDGGAGSTRTAAWCVSPVGGDVSCTMVKGGWALRWDRHWRGHMCER
jgi:hypothetical protein